ncbi:MAG: hypothetical protein AAF492_12500 [Verrucomicrobiota bacterium]
MRTITGLLMMLTVNPCLTMAEEMIERLIPVPPYVFDQIVLGDDKDEPISFEAVLEEKRSVKKAQAFFEDLGVPFPEKSSMFYNAAISSLVVMNTPNHLEQIERLVNRLFLQPTQIDVEHEFVSFSRRELETNSCSTSI